MMIVSMFNIGLCCSYQFLIQTKKNLKLSISRNFLCAVLDFVINYYIRPKIKGFSHYSRPTLLIEEKIGIVCPF